MAVQKLTQENFESTVTGNKMVIINFWRRGAVTRRDTLAAGPFAGAARRGTASSALDRS